MAGPAAVEDKRRFELPMLVGAPLVQYFQDWRLVARDKVGAIYAGI